jgi:hypothetical protein
MMVELELLQTVQIISNIAGALGVCIAVIYYVLNLRNTQQNMKMTLETRQALFTYYLDKIEDKTYADNFNELSRKWQWSDYDDFMAKYGPAANPAEWWKLTLTLTPMEELGILTKHGVFDPAMIFDQMFGYIISFWEKFEPVLNEYRKRSNSGRSWEYCEDFYFIMKEMNVKDKVAYQDRFANRKNRRKALGLEMTALYSD